MTTQTAHHATRTHANGHVKTFPAAKQLATRTDLTTQETQAITQALNPLIADSFALYVKTKNFHWHLSGSHFRDFHLLFDEHADALLASIDILAERVRRVGGTTIRSVSHVGELQTIKDDNDEYVSPGEMARRLMDDNAAMAKAQRAAHEVCDKNRDYATASELEVLIDQTERRTWFLYEVCQGMNNTD
jgi:starvation-inducible DNA-binding protein